MFVTFDFNPPKIPKEFSNIVDHRSHPGFSSKIVRLTSASLYATGTVRKGVGDTNLRIINNGQEITPFFEENLFSLGTKV